MICAFDECGNSFEPHRHNQKYCSPDCCKSATNKRIRNKYYAAKRRLDGEKRICSTCDTYLSRYTEDDVCGKCVAEKRLREREILRNMFNGVKISNAS